VTSPSPRALPDRPPELAAGDGVRLRAYREDDVDAVLAMASEETFARWTTVPLPYQHADAERFVREVVPAG